MKISEMKLQPREGSIVLGGRDVVVRALTIAESEALARTKPRPRPAMEMVFDPNLGRSMRMEKLDPATEDSRREWAEFMQCAEVAAAAGIASSKDAIFGAGFAPEHNAAWAADVVAEMRASFTWPEIEKASRVIAELSSAPMQAAEKLKN